MTKNLTTTLTFKGNSVAISHDRPTAIIGERINPTGRKKLQAALLENNFDLVCQDAMAQVEAGAAILDVNAGVPGADESELLREIVRAISRVVQVPLCIDTTDPAV